MALLCFITVRASPDSTNQLNQVISVSQAQNQVTSGGVTIVKVGAPPQPVPALQGGYTRRAKLGDSRSTGRLHTATNTNTHRSMTRLNIAGMRVSQRLMETLKHFARQRIICTKINDFVRRGFSWGPAQEYDEAELFATDQRHSGTTDATAGEQRNRHRHQQVGDPQHAGAQRRSDGDDNIPTQDAKAAQSRTPHARHAPSDIAYE